jgi:hypothetical protein
LLNIIIIITNLFIRFKLREKNAKEGLKGGTSIGLETFTEALLKDESCDFKKRLVQIENQLLYHVSMLLCAIL